MKICKKDASNISAFLGLTLGLAANMEAMSQQQGDALSASTAEHIESVFIYGNHEETRSATKLNLTIFETPQNVIAISRAQIDDFALYDINDVLNYTPGVTVEEVETDRTYYTARGFDIVNFQYDGVGTPFTSGLSRGHQDTAVYEKVEVIKGAAGLITGLANPSATINYVRKRPTEELLLGARAASSDWGGYRLEGDVGGSVSSRIRGRLVLVTEESESWLDRHEEEGAVAYGIIEADLSAATRLTLGHSYNDSSTKGNMWGALPLLYTDGSRTDYDVSTSTAPDWARAAISHNQSFVQLEQEINSKWSFNANYTFNNIEQDSKLFYVYGTPERGTELGLAASSSAYLNEEEQSFFDLYVSGSFELGGREHDLVVGYNAADIATDAGSYYDPINGYPTLGSDWAAGSHPEPNFNSHDPFGDATDIEQEQKSFYFSSRLNLSDKLSVLLGARKLTVDQDGFSYGGSSETDADEIVPYAGITWLLNENLSLYASMSEVFIQQTWVNEDLQPLGATEGENSELGFKQTFNDGLAILTVAYFQTENYNLGEFDRRIDGVAVYHSRDYDSDGFEVEVSGELIESLNVSAGFTKVNIEDQQGNAARPFIPSALFTLSGSYQIPALPALKIGGVLQWQDSVQNPSEVVEQDAFTLLDVMASYEFENNISVALNIENLTDEKYLNSLYWDQGFYGAPRNVRASVSWRY